MIESNFILFWKYLDARLTYQEQMYEKADAATMAVSHFVSHAEILYN